MVDQRIEKSKLEQKRLQSDRMEQKFIGYGQKQLQHQWPYSPEANSIIRTADGSRIDLSRFRVDGIGLNLGDQVERQLMDGDVVMMNRNPSHYKTNMLGHIIKVLPGATFRLNLAATTPYSADFDGDEMNLFAPQSLMAKAEIQELAMINKHVLDSQSGAPLLGLVQDSLLALHLLTRRDTFIDFPRLADILVHFPRWDGHIPHPAILKPKALWTGKQLVSMVMPAGINLGRNKQRGEWTSLKRQDAKVIIRNGDLLVGQLCVRNLGPDHPDTIQQKIAQLPSSKDCPIPREMAIDFLNDIQMVANAWLVQEGFSIGIGDTITEQDDAITDKDIGEMEKNLYWLKWELVKTAGARDGRRTVREEYEARALEMVMAKAEEKCRTYVGRIRENGGKNALFTMADAGSKGTHKNIYQIVACVGQQTVEGERIGYRGLAEENRNSGGCFRGRTLPHFIKHGDYGVWIRSKLTNPGIILAGPHSLPVSFRGFVPTSLRDGLKPVDFFFHAMSGREGLVAMRLGTSQAGYLQRRMVKCMENLMLCHDGTVRNNPTGKTTKKQEKNTKTQQNTQQQKHNKRQKQQQLVQWHYGDDEQGATDTKIVHCPENEHGEMVGVLAAQCLGGPASQMALDKRHHVGGAACRGGSEGSAMTRLVELVDAVKMPKRPRMSIYLKEGQDATKLRHKLEFINLGEVASKSEILYEPPNSATSRQSKPDKQRQKSWINWITRWLPNKKKDENQYLTDDEEDEEMMSPWVIRFTLCRRRMRARRVSVRHVMRAIRRALGTFSEDVELEHTEKGAPGPVEVRMRFRCNEYLEGTCRYGDCWHFQCSPYRGTLIPNKKSSEYLNKFRQLPDGHQFMEETNDDHPRFLVWMQSEFMGRLCLRGHEDIKRVKIVQNPNGEEGEEPMLQAELRRNYKDTGIGLLLMVLTKRGVDAEQTSSRNWREAHPVRTCRNDPRKDPPVRTYSNNVHEVRRVLGIEAARELLKREMQEVVDNGGIRVSGRHIALICDNMTVSGELIGNTRFGARKQHLPPLQRSTFEEMQHHLSNAAAHAEPDLLKGVSERIITGKLTTIGTGCSGLMMTKDDYSKWGPPPKNCSNFSPVHYPLLPMPPTSSSPNSTSSSPQHASSASSSSSQLFLLIPKNGSNNPDSGYSPESPPGSSPASPTGSLEDVRPFPTYSAKNPKFRIE